MERISLFEELRLIEKSENEVNGAWKGAHLLLFFLAFVFGSFCTFCFHMLMYLFDEKCVLFPKLLSLTSLRHNIIYEFIPEDKERIEMLPVDFVSTQWVEKSACYLPTYIPLVSGIFGLVWTTMFLMCSTGSRTLTGLQRPWRVIPPVFVFSILMAAICIYSSAVTHYGLKELCAKLGEITGSSTCSYTVNVATLMYERKIRGVYQATRLTIISAWLHTGCWLLSALLALVRVLLAVDFQLVKVSVELVGNVDKMMERNEHHLRKVSPNGWTHTGSNSSTRLFSTRSNTQLHYRNEYYQGGSTNDIHHRLFRAESDLIFMSDRLPDESKLSLVPEEQIKLARREAFQSVPRQHRFIVKLIHDLLDSIDLPETPTPSLSDFSLMENDQYSKQQLAVIRRQYGQQKIISDWSNAPKSQYELTNTLETEKLTNEIKHSLREMLFRQLTELPIAEQPSVSGAPSTSQDRYPMTYESSMNITLEMRETLGLPLDGNTKESKKVDEELTTIMSQKKSNLKNIGIQTDKNAKKGKKQKVTIISESRSTFTTKDSDSNSNDSNKDEDTQTLPKEKQD